MKEDKSNPPYVVEYRHKGKIWGLQIWAEDWADAEARLWSIAYNGKIIGSDCQTIPVNSFTLPVGGFWVRLICWWRNLGKLS